MRTKISDRRIYPTAEGIRNVIRLLGSTNEKIRRFKLVISHEHASPELFVLPHT
jgi:hypothetical protein